MLELCRAGDGKYVVRLSKEYGEGCSGYSLGESTVTTGIVAGLCRRLWHGEEKAGLSDEVGILCRCIRIYINVFSLTSV